MKESLDLIHETLEYFNEGAISVRAHTDETTYVITKIPNTEEFWVATEEPGFKKVRVSSLSDYYAEVFGVEARY